jgi:branched-subunit amino acid ABC-type transport system permease component
MNRMKRCAWRPARPSRPSTLGDTAGQIGALLILAGALGLAITYGLLGVINMAHGELLMLGAYSTYVVQALFATYLPGGYGWYLLAALPVPSCSRRWWAC